MALIALALAPVIFLMTYFYLQDRYEREPLRYLFLAFFLGCLTIFPAIVLELAFDKYVKLPTETMWGMLVYALLGIALVEEGLKFAMLRLFIYKREALNEPYDGIIYSVAVSMGFAAVENIMYVVQHGYGTGILRMFTAVPGHAMFGVLMGFFVGLAKFKGGRMVSFLLQLTGIIAAVIPHALYDFFLFKVQNVPWFIGLAAAVLLIALILSIKSVRIHMAESPFRNRQEPLA